MGQAGVRVAAPGARRRSGVRWCRRCPRSASSRRSISSGRSKGLEPLSFVLGRLMEPLSAHLERRDRGAAVLHVRLHLVSKAVHARTLQLPTPLRDARTLRTLALLDLESHPPAAAIDRVVVAVDPTPGRIVQYSLLTRPLPAPEQMSTLMARLGALMGEDRCGSPACRGLVAARRVCDEGVRARRRQCPAHRPQAPRCTWPPVSRVAALPAARAGARRRGTRRARCASRRIDGACRAAASTQASGPWRTSGGWWDDSPPRRLPLLVRHSQDLRLRSRRRRLQPHVPPSCHPHGLPSYRSAGRVMGSRRVGRDARRRRHLPSVPPSRR